MGNKSILDLFYDKPIVEIKDGKIYFSAKPKFHFFDRSHVNYQTIIGEKLNVIIPIVDPDYDTIHTQFGRELNRRIGRSCRYFDKMIYLLLHLPNPGKLHRHK